MSYYIYTGCKNMDPLRMLRKCMVKLGKLVSTYNRRLSTTEFIHMCSAIKTSKYRNIHVFVVLELLTIFVSLFYVVLTGGYIFECYLTMNSSYSTNKLWNTYQKQADNTVDGKLLQWQNEELLNMATSSFVGHLIQTLGSLGTNGRRQLFYHTLACNYFGLSREGIFFLSQYGYTCSLDHFDDLRKVCCHESTERSRYRFIIYDEKKKIILFFCNYFWFSFVVYVVVCLYIYIIDIYANIFI